MNDIIIFIVGFSLFPLSMFVIAKLNAEKFALFILAILNKIFTPEQANAVSNLLGIKFIEFGLGLITGIDDNKVAKEHVEEIKTRTKTLKITFSRRW